MLFCNIVATEGFDRHLFGLYLIAKEEGLPTPELFTDLLYAKRYYFFETVCLYRLYNCISVRL